MDLILDVPGILSDDKYNLFEIRPLIRWVALKRLQIVTEQEKIVTGFSCSHEKAERIFKRGHKWVCMNWFPNMPSSLMAIII